MNTSLTTLMADVLNGQTETADEAMLAAAAARFATYIRGASWTDGDRRLVWTSPGARRLYLTAKLAKTRDVSRLWSDRGFARDLQLRAADSEGADHVLSGAGMTVRILKVQGMKNWLIQVALSEEAAEILGNATSIRLADTGGRVWVEGAPDGTGALDAFWEDEDEAPAARLRQHTLRLDFF